MTSESKILTVSYGSFSCSLEGYDDPFTTMKAIAEYFQDLTTEDRHFGSEPPQPDAAAVYRTSRPEGDRQIEVPGGPAADPQDAPAASLRRAGSGQAGAKTGPAPVEPSVRDVIPAGVAAKLARIRLSVAATPTGGAFAEEARRGLPSGATTDADDGQPPEADSAGSIRDAVEALLRMPREDTADRTVLAPQDALSDMDLPDADPAPHAEHDSTADHALPDDSHTDGADLDRNADMAEVGVLAEAGELDPDETAHVTDDAAETAFPVMAEGGPDLGFAATRAVEPGNLPEEDVTLADAIAEAEAETLQLSADSVGEAVTSPVGEPEPEEAAPEPLSAPASVERQAPAAKTTGKTRRVNSRVVRIHPEADAPDLPVTRQERQSPQPSDEDVAEARLQGLAALSRTEDDTRRRSDSIAQLRAAFAAAETERQHLAEMAPSPLVDEDEPEPDLAASEPAPVPPTSLGSDRAVPGGPTPLVLVSEQRIDRSGLTAQPTFHPAALVPTPAAPSIAPGIAAPGGHGKASLRTGRLTGAIGIGAAKPVAPLTTHAAFYDHDTSQGHAADTEDEDDLDEVLSDAEVAGLQRFADRVGVKSIADMLEAVAAYALCVEQRDRFTRQQLMLRLMAAAAGKSVSREDGLRSFGTLLRTGRIEKVSRGHYVLAAHSPYLAEARRIG